MTSDADEGTDKDASSRRPAEQTEGHIEKTAVTFPEEGRIC
jgi:hypothetical protein